MKKSKSAIYQKIAAGLAFAMAVTMLPGGGMVTKAETHKPQTKDTPKNVELNVGNLVSSDGKWRQVFGSETEHDNRIYFGNFNGTATTYRVLDCAGGKLLIDSDKVLENGYFVGSKSEANVYMGSQIQKYLEGDGYYNSGMFSTVEKKAIAATTSPAFDDYASLDSAAFRYDMMSQNNTDTMIKDALIDYEMPNQHVFLLSAKDVATYYPADGNSAAKGAIDDSVATYENKARWYLRTTLRGNFNDCVTRVNNSNPQIYKEKIYLGNPCGVSPAMNLKQSQIVFASNTKFNKKASLNSVAAASGKDWKLTLLDTGKKVGIQSGKSVSVSGSTVKVPYTSSGSGINQISVMITNKEITQTGASVLYYGALSTSSLSQGEASFTLPSGLPSGYKMYILAEKVGASTASDYASAPLLLSTSSQPVAPTVPQKGKIYTVNNIKYKVTNARTDGNGTVSVVGLKDNTKPYVTIPKKASIKGYSYKITKLETRAFKGFTKLKTMNIQATGLKEIQSEVFYGCKNMTKLTVDSKYLEKIGRKACYNCSNLKNVTLKTTKLNKDNVGSYAFKGTYSRCHFDVPNAKVSAYKKLFISKGANKRIVVD